MINISDIMLWYKMYSRTNRKYISFPKVKKKTSFRNTCILKHINKCFEKAWQGKAKDSERVHLVEWGKQVKGRQGREHYSNVDKQGEQTCSQG